MLAAVARAEQPNAGAVVIDSNENPLGPSQAARSAIATIIPQSGRYSDDLTIDLVHAFAQIEGLDPDWVAITAGSTPPLVLSVLAFTSPQKSFVSPDPCFELGMFAAQHGGARVVKVPLTKNYTHDVRGMLAAAPDAGVFYICSPNNPTGTVTPHADVEYLVAHKPKDAIVLADEAYLHFSENAQSAVDLVKAGKDVIVLRTFSKQKFGSRHLSGSVATASPIFPPKRIASWSM
jgi:histidinol-phosphate aminotransferase